MVSVSTWLFHGLPHIWRHVEAALGQLEVVQAKLAQNERELQAEIDALREELRKDQDPSRMQLLQEMISVCSPTQNPYFAMFIVAESFARAASRIYWGRCPAYARRPQSQKLLYGISRKKYRFSTLRRRTSS